MFDDIRPHLVELRKRLGLSVLSIFVAFCIAFLFHTPILTWITQPLNNALTQVGKIIESKEQGNWQVSSNEKNQTRPISSADIAKVLHEKLKSAATLAQDKLSVVLQEASDAAKKLSELLQKKQASSVFNGQITTQQVGGAFLVAIKVSFFAGLLGALPFILYQIWLFIAPGLYNHEKKMILPFVVGGSVMFFIGILFAYYVVTPFGFQFLITFGSFLYTPLINIEDYVGFFTKIMMGFGIAFELPVFAYFLALLRLVTDKTLIDFFRYAILIIFVLAALLTPPDVFTQLLMAAPLIILYGLSILIVRAVNPYVADDDDKEEETVVKD